MHLALNELSAKQFIVTSFLRVCVCIRMVSPEKNYTNSGVAYGSEKLSVSPSYKSRKHCGIEILVC